MRGGPPGGDGPGRGDVGIVGLGLIGGSLARDLAAAGWNVLGADRDPVTMERARASGTIADALEPEAAGALDVLVLAVPVHAVADWLDRLSGTLDPGAGVVLTDTGSTKRSVLAAAERAGLAERFVGGHPMAGDHRRGWEAGRAGLFRGADVWICPTASTARRAIETVEGLWRTVGGRPRRSGADDHDRLLARTSHLPQLAASALAATLADQRVGRDGLGPGGRDGTRLAASDPDLWTGIVLDNGDHVAPALRALADELLRLEAAVRAGDGDALRQRLEAARAWKTS